MREVTGSSHAEPSQPRCDSVNSLSNNLEKLLRHTTKFVLVFDDIDRQREATPTLVPGLARLGSIVRSK
jgi:origin recognition complex subunit 5